MTQLKKQFEFKQGLCSRVGPVRSAGMVGAIL